MSALIVLCTFPDLESARHTGTMLVESQLAACVNLCPHIESIYRWQGQIEKTAEVLAVFKTTEEALPRFGTRLRELHPYDLPEIVAIKPDAVNADYAAWLTQGVPPEP